MSFQISGENIFIREWNILDARKLSSLAESTSVENAELRIIDWGLQFTQTKIGTFPVFTFNENLIGLISLKPKIKEGRAVFQITAHFDTQHAFHRSEAATLLQKYAKEQLGITAIEDQHGLIAQ